MPIRLSCPSCNTAFTLPELPADRRATCPRCGDVFPIRGFAEVDEREAAGEVPGQTPNPRAAALGAARAWSIYRSVLVAGLLGLIGLGVGVWVSLRDRHRPDNSPSQRPEEEVIPASQLAGLGYLPADTNIAFAAQPGAVVAYARQRNQEPRDLLVKAGIPAKILDTLAGLGLTLSQIDHIAGGTHLGDAAFELRLTLVLVLRQPLADEEQFREKLKAKRQPGGKERFDVQLGGLPLTLARVSPTVWVFGFEASKDLEAVDRGGYGPGGRQFRPGLLEMIARGAPGQAAAWFATDDDHWAEKPAVKLALQAMKKPGWLPIIARGRAAGGSLSFGERPRLRLFVRTADEAAGQQLRDYFKELAARSDNPQHGGGGELAYFETDIDPTNAYATLQRMFGDARK